MPVPEDLREYESILPGAAERVLRLMEGEALHRRGIDVKQVDHIIAQDVRKIRWNSAIRLSGMGVGLLVVGGVLKLAAIVAQLGYAWQAVAICGIDLAALVGVFIQGANMIKNARAAKDNQLTIEEQNNEDTGHNQELSEEEA